MDAPYSTSAIANWFLDRAERDNCRLDPMKLQKLIYFAHGWYLALSGKPLIDEHPQAWAYGPVIPSIYHKFKSFGRSAITQRAWDLDGVLKDGVFEAKMQIPSIGPDREMQEFLEQIWKVYGGYSAIQLSNLSHQPNGAWDKAYAAAGGNRSVDIPDDLIKAEFESKRSRGAAV